MITVKILADSINPAGKRITSWLLTYPRFIHSEFMTHRVFSRNAASSRAIPLATMIKNIEDQTAQPELWARNDKGMQGNIEVEDPTRARDLWLCAGSEMISYVKQMNDETPLHKAILNRLIEPWSHITVLATATDHGNFFALRAHPDAMPEFQVLAYRMLAQYLEHPATQLKWGEWHIPEFENTGRAMGYRGQSFDDTGDPARSEAERIQIATGRCARLSYLTQDGAHDPLKDIELHDRLLASGHMSPFEHCACAHRFDGPFEYPWSNFDQCGQASEWRQYRKQFENENRSNVDLAEVMTTKPDWITL